MNQATAEKTSVKLAAAIKTPRTIDTAHEDFSATPGLYPSLITSLFSSILRPFELLAECTV